MRGKKDTTGKQRYHALFAVIWVNKYEMCTQSFQAHCFSHSQKSNFYQLILTYIFHHPIDRFVTLWFHKLIACGKNRFNSYHNDCVLIMMNVLLYKMCLGTSLSWSLMTKLYLLYLMKFNLHSFHTLEIKNQIQISFG